MKLARGGAEGETAGAMRIERSKLGLAACVVAAGVLAGGEVEGAPTAAKPPAYTLQGLTFSTTMHGVPEGERREGCIDAACSEASGVVVAEGQTRGAASPVTIAIREHKKKGATKGDLEKLAKKKLGHAPGGGQVREVAGLVGGRPALEQWAIWDSCNRVVTARVFVSLPDKVLEIETRGTVEPGHDAGDTPVERMDQLLKAVRVRRLGDAKLDPAREAMTPRQVAVALEKQGCAGG